VIQIIIQGRDDSGAAAQSAAGNVRKVGDEAEKQGSRLKGFFDGVKGVMLGAGVAMGGALVAAAGAGLGFNNAIEQASAKINAFTNDGEKTAEILEMVKDRASKTPFEFDQMANAASALMPTVKASGKSLEELLEISEILAASNPAEGLEGAAFALKEATSGDFTSIIERFNLPRQRLKELKEQGVPDIEAVKIAMRELGLDGDLVANMANTLEGRWSTFKDTIVSTLGVITQPIFDAMSGGLANVNDLLTSATPQITAFAEQAAGMVGQAIEWAKGIAAFGQSFSDAVADAGLFSTEVNEVIGSVTGPLLEQVGQWVAALGQWVIDAIPGMGANMASFVQDLLTQVGAATWIDGFVRWIIEAAPLMLTELGVYAASMLGFLQANLPAIMSQLALWGAQFISWLVDVVPDLLLAGGELVANLLNWIIDSTPGFIENLKQWSTAFVAWLQETTPKVIDEAGKLWDQLAGWLNETAGSVVPLAKEVGAGIISGISQGISSGAESIKRAAASAAKAALDAAKSALGIKSPSLVFANLVGAPIAQGMALGMAQNIPMVQSAAGSLASAAVAGGQSAQVGGSVGVSLSMNGGLERYIDAKIDNQMKVYSRNASDRRLG
jgi:hypothetical protein